MRVGSLLVVACCAISAAVGSSAKAFFFDSFDEDFEGRWTQSKDPAYTGKFTYEKSDGVEDFGLYIPDKAKKYGIATELKEPVDFAEGTVVLQYDVRLQKGYDCGGAYIKFLMPQEEGWTQADFKDNTPYSVMFGPDKCGATNKVHFIFRHKSPKTGEYVEHHLDKAPAPHTEWVSHVYTAVINRANNSVKILIDGEYAASGDLMSYQDFKPSVLLPETIRDPNDKKPEDWDERPKIPDPDAKKPDDWDEDAPPQISDVDAQKPEGWLDDEPLEVDDPEAAKPDDWDDEEDGEWEPPKIKNPKCDEAPGCGEWKRPMKKNPLYKGKWKAPMIENPAYKGKWSPRDIPNPDYFELEHPVLEPITAVGIEIWTMTNEVIFDNILITDSEEEAEEYRDRFWKPKHEKEEALRKQKQSEEDEERKDKEPKVGLKGKVFGKLYAMTDLPFLAKYSAQLKALVSKGEENEYATYGILVFIVVILPLLLLVALIVPRKASAVPRAVPLEVAKKEDISTPDDESKEDDSAPESTEGVDSEEKIRRRTRRDT